MNNLTNSEIWARVEEDYRELERDFPNSRILCTFVVGKVNYNEAEVLADIDTISIIFPTIENLALNGGYIRDIKNHKSGGRKYIIDFRDVYINSHWAEMLGTDFTLVNSFYKKVYTTLPRIILEQGQGLKCDEEFRAGLLNIFNQYLTMKDGIQEKLFKTLTKTEEKALIYILETIGPEGNISISTAIANSGISRPVFTSLFEKLDRYKGAEIKNQGVKGTYINFYDHVLSKFDIKEN